MATFSYTVRDASGQTRTGTSEAENAEILKRRLQEQGFTVADIKQTALAVKYDTSKDAELPEEPTVGEYIWLDDGLPAGAKQLAQVRARHIARRQNGRAPSRPRQLEEKIGRSLITLTSAPAHR